MGFRLTRSSPGFNSWSLFLLLYINDLQKIESYISNPVLFADDTSIIVTKPSHTEFTNDSSKVFGYINERFRNNKSFFKF